MISVSTRISPILVSKSRLTRTSRQNTIASSLRRYCRERKSPYDGLESDIATKHAKRFSNQPDTPDAVLMLPPMVKTWIKAESVFTTPDKTNLANRRMGTIEQVFCNLSNNGLPTTSVRLFRLKMFLDDVVMYEALAALQRMRPELWGTIPRTFNSHPAYVNTYDSVTGPEKPEVKEPENVPKNLEAALKKQQEYTAMPKDFVPIPLEVIEGGDQATYLSEMTNLLNHPFEEGAPLLKVRIVRHAGGSDLLVAAHQALFDEGSLGYLCLQILDLYDLASEGRMSAVAKQTFRMISSVDDLYPAAFRTERDRLSSNLLTSNKLAKLALAHPWVRFPQSSDFRSPTPPSPLLNATAAIFGKLSIESSNKFARQCQKENMTLESGIAAAVLLSAASVMREHQETMEGTTSEISHTETTKKQERKTPRKSKQKKSRPKVPNETDESKQILLGNIAEQYEMSKKKEEPDLTTVSFIASLIFSLRPFFDPPMTPPNIGYLNSHLLLPVHISKKNSIWEIAKNVTEVKYHSNYQNDIYNDILLLPRYAALCLSDTKWRDNAIPTLTISDTTSNTLLPETRDRFSIYDTKAVNSCWMPGIQVSSHVEMDQLQISISYRRPLIPDKVAHQLLIATLKELSL